MRQRIRIGVSLLLGMALGGIAWADATPAQTVQSFIEAHRQGRFAQAQSLLVGPVDARGSLFSNWLFRPGTAGAETTTADIFLSRKFVEAFQYQLIDTAPNGDNQAFVTAIRTSPDLAHLYTWALAPLRGAPPYTLIEAVDTYLTKVNFPVEESQMRFTLIREVGSWYISAIRDEKFIRLQEQVLSQAPLAAASGTAPNGLTGSPAGSPTAAPSVPPAAPEADASNDLGRQTADAQFDATLKSFNQLPPPQPAAVEAKAEESQSLLGKFTGLFKREKEEAGEGERKTVVLLSDAKLRETFNGVRDALARFAQSNNSIPNSSTIYDWRSLRQVVNFYGETPLPKTEAEAGFSFVNYESEGLEDYVLLVEFSHPQNGLSRVEVTPYGIDRVN
ncbi:MAG TPA: hypothetical protein VEG60_19405 [Candidatus Binatia bacterium]|nr:hypothetical protein [Candidatus Binatia bacterium]